MNGWDAIRAGIFAGESGGDYGAVYGYQNRPGGRFADTDLTKMTVNQVLDFTNPRGPYAQFVKGQVGRVATPVGAYQVVGSTLRAARDGLGLTGDEPFDQATQDRIGQWIYQTQGTGAWEGYRGPGDPNAAPRQGARETLSTSGLLSEAPMDEPQQGPLGGLLGIKRDTGKINDLGLALMALSSPRAAPAFMQMAQGRREEAAGRRKEREEAGRANRTTEWLGAQPGGQQFAALAEALGPAAAVQAYMQAQKAAADSAGGVEYGLTPQYGVDAEGNPVIIQLGKDGTSTRTPLPEGVTFQKEPIRIDAGTHWVLLDPITRQPVGQIEKDSRGDARNTAVGKAEGEAAGAAIAAAPAANARAEAIAAQIDDLLADPGLARVTGPIQGRLPNVSADAHRAQSKVDQVLGNAFLEGRQLLKGGGAITDFESRKAEQAFIRANQAQSDEDFRKAMEDFRDAVRAGAAKLAAQSAAAGGAPVSAPPPAPAPVPVGDDELFKKYGIAP